MKQLFAVSRKAGIAQANTMLEHAAFGTMMGEDGKPFKTRSGGTIKLIDLITEAKARAYKMIAERNIEWNESEIKHLADTLAIASIKYADLSKNRLSDYIFSFDKMLAFEGNTAPYLLYAYTRIISIFRKSEVDLAIIDSYKLEIVEAAEHKLALHLTKFADKLAEAARDNYPHYLCSYLYELAGLFMRFYESCPILKDGTAIEVRQSRLRLSNIAAATLKTGLDLLGISVVDKM
jgi:arginyl-tRNA synthetase